MASRKEQKEAARQQRIAAEQAAAQRHTRRRQLEILGGVAAVAVGVIVAFIIVSSSGGSSNQGLTGTGLARNQAQVTTYTKQVRSLLAGIPQNGVTLGSAKAPVTVTYYGDFECPVCRAFTLGAFSGGFPTLISKDVRQGKVKVVFRSLCTATCNNAGQAVFNKQQVAAYAAGRQNLFWDYAELFYREQGDETTGYVTDAYLANLAKQTPGLNLSQWQTDRGNPSYLAQVQADQSLASADGFSSTPQIVVSGPKGPAALAPGVVTYGQIEQAIKQVS